MGQQLCRPPHACSRGSRCSSSAGLAQRPPVFHGISRIKDTSSRVPAHKSHGCSLLRHKGLQESEIQASMPCQIVVASLAAFCAIAQESMW